LWESVERLVIMREGKGENEDGMGKEK